LPTEYLTTREVYLLSNLILQPSVEFISWEPIAWLGL